MQEGLSPSLEIEDFRGDWKKSWFSYRPKEWSISTHKLHATVWAAPPKASLELSLRVTEANKMVVLLDEYAAELEVGTKENESFLLHPSDFKNYSGEELTAWDQIRTLKLTHAQHLRPGRGQSGQPRLLGANWRGPPPEFQKLQWVIAGSQ